MKNRIIYLLVASMVSISGYTQLQNKVKAADKQYDKYAYVDAITTYERVFERGYKSEDMLKKLGNAYYFKADLDNAYKWYGELFAFAPNVAEPEYYYRYAQALKSQKEYKKADEMMAKFNQMSGNDLRAKLSSSQKDYLAIIKKNSGRFTVENAGINSEHSDYGSAYFGDKVVFASARDTGSVGSNRHRWTGESFTNLYAADKSPEGNLSGVKKLTKKLNSQFHESTPVFTKDGTTAYFTRNNYNNGKKGRDANKTILLKLYKATIDGTTWKDIKELPFNSNDYSVAHPALSPDEKTLYFASDMPGTTGLSDIWKTSINGDDTYGTPENLGTGINTEGRETFPFVTPENEMYFASDGQPGLGGLDVYYSKADKEGVFKNIYNIGEPINSPKDDFGFIIDNATRTGYFTSNREGGNGNDDIYKFKENKKLPVPEDCKQLLQGVLTDPASQSPIANAKVTLSDADHKLIKETTTDKDGNYNFGEAKCGEKFYIKAESEDYGTVEMPVVVGKESGKTDVPLELERTRFTPRPGLDLAKAFKINMIYFDLDKYYIRPDAEVELAKILIVLEQYPAMELDIRSHTDCRQTVAYNERLSDNRAKSTMAWLVGKGIAKTRLTAKGYGESQLVNNCPCEPTNESSCSEEEHQQNRRSEFVIMKM
jgi:outer membrane protein OmpA-like peptidoglycan-associated protein